MKQDNEEINKWIESYSGLLLNRALSMVTDKNDAMDLVQEVFISASLSYHAFQRRSTPLTWLQNILKNKIADFYRDRYRKPETVSIPDFSIHRVYGRMTPCCTNGLVFSMNRKEKIRFWMFWTSVSNAFHLNGRLP